MRSRTVVPLLSAALFVLAAASVIASAQAEEDGAAGASVASRQEPAMMPVGVARVTPERPLGTEDLLEISVFEIPELNRTVRVSEKGRISLPLLGDIETRGLTRRGLEVKLKELLEERFVQNPQVSVFVREHASKRVSVLGAVGKPGVYEMLGPRTLLQVLSEAGGLTEEVGSDLYVIRVHPDGTSHRTVISVYDLLVNSDPRLNIAIEPGDIVSAPIDRLVYIYVDGAVKTPGRIEQLASRPITLLQAIAKAGGATERANLKGVQILRQSPDGTQTVLEANLKRIRKGKEPDPILGEGDVVVVPETFF
ncbi:MAG: polysaccharide biosynthesis/export family protein [Acidobacteriota bacterium]